MSRLLSPAHRPWSRHTPPRRRSGDGPPAARRHDDKPAPKPEQLAARFGELLRSVTRGTFGMRPRRTTPRDRPQRVTIPAPVLDRKACCPASYEVVARLDGVEQATATFKGGGKVTALLDPSKTDRGKLEDALRRVGVPVPKQ